MGNETILYYVTQETIKNVIRRHFWQKQELPFFMVEQDNLKIYVVLVPMQQKRWHKQGKNCLKIEPGTKGQLLWNPEKLLRLMQDAQERIGQYEQEMKPDDFIQEHIVLQPDIAAILHWEKEEIPAINLFLSSKILSLRKQDFDSVVLLLRNDVFPELQMRYFAEMMQPFFSRINHLSILYDVDNEEQDRWQEAITEYTDAFYYEYGLMVQVLGRKGKNGKRTLFLDYGYERELPLRMMRPGDVYLDVAASGEKETLLKRKCAEVSYLSPLKYLDTTVKSGYDKLVHLCK